MTLDLEQFGSFRRRLLTVGLVFLAVLFAVMALPIREWLAGFAGVLEMAGTAGMLAFTALDAVLTVVLVPRAALNLLAGMVYGLSWGTAVAVVASVFGAWLAFMVGRLFLRSLVQDARRRSRLWRGLDEVAQRHPIRLTTLWHFSLVLPFSVINYWMGGSGVRVGDFLLGKLIGVLPATFAYVWMGTLIPDLLSLAAGEIPDSAQSIRLWMVGGGVAMTLVLMAWLGRASMRALKGLDVD